MKRDLQNHKLGSIAPAKKGRTFELEVAELFRAAGFSVNLDAGAASPRQTDIFAHNERTDFLIEVKNRKRKIDVSDVDNLRSRLNRTSSDIVGIIFSASETTQNALREIEADRKREILVFVRSEIDQIKSGEQTLIDFLHRKRTELRTAGKVWIGGLAKVEYVDVKLPISTISFRKGKRVGYLFEANSGFDSAFFSLEIPNPSWPRSSGGGVCLSIPLDLRTAKSLRNLAGYIHSQFGLSVNGMFSIQQSHTCWYGVGIENFLRSIERWSTRYRSSAPRGHHSETLRYFDRFRSGWIEICAQHRVNLSTAGARNEAFLYNSDLTICLPGTPVDLSKFELLRQYAYGGWAYFEPILDNRTFNIRFRKPICVTPLATLLEVSQRDKYVVGVVVPNPFYEAGTLPSELQEYDGSLSTAVTSNALLICSVKDWYPPNKKIGHHRLYGIEFAFANRGLILRPYCTWDDPSPP